MCGQREADSTFQRHLTRLSSTFMSVYQYNMSCRLFKRLRGAVFVFTYVYSGTSDKGPSEIGTTSLQRTLVSIPC